MKPTQQQNKSQTAAEYRQRLADELEIRLARNPSYSQAAFARDLDITDTDDESAPTIDDISVIMLIETEDSIVPYCGSTSYSDRTLKARFSGKAVNKNNPAQMAALERGSGVCSNVFLDDFHDLTRVSITASGGAKQTVILTKVYP